MNAFEIFAIISNGQVVDTVHYVFNSGGYTQANVHAMTKFGEGTFAVNITYYPVGIGDTYYGGRFYRNGAEIHSMPTEQEEIDSLNNAVDDLVIAVLGG